MKLKKNLLAFILTLILCLPLAFPRNVGAQTRSWQDINPDCVENAADTGHAIDTGDADRGVATIVGFECIAVNILNIGVSAVGIASFVMVLVGAVMYLTSGGDPRKTEVGSKTLSYAGFGLLVSISGWVIINFLATFTGVDSIKTLNINVDNITP